MQSFVTKLVKLLHFKAFLIWHKNLHITCALNNIIHICPTTIFFYILSWITSLTMWSFMSAIKLESDNVRWLGRWVCAKCSLRSTKWRFNGVFMLNKVHRVSYAQMHLRYTIKECNASSDVCRQALDNNWLGACEVLRKSHKRALCGLTDVHGKHILWAFIRHTFSGKH